MIGSTSLTAGRAGVQVFLAADPVDMRKSFDTLAEVVRAFLGHDPLSGSLFVFRNRSKERVKILWFAEGGLTIYYKRLEKGTFQFPACGEKSLIISSADLVKLLAGCAVELSTSIRDVRRVSGLAPDFRM